MASRSVFAIAFGSAVIGGVAGAALTVWAAGSEKPRSGAPAVNTERPATAADAAVATRFAAVEQRLRALELRRELVARSAASSAAAGDKVPEPRAEFPGLVDDPVFEAAVRDILDRAEEDRAGERQARRDERRRAEVQRWTERLDERLKLSATQKTKLAQIASDYWSQVRTLWEGDGGAPPPRETRLKQVREARDAADAAIRQALDPRQAAQYDELEDELKLGARRFGRAATP